MHCSPGVGILFFLSLRLAKTAEALGERRASG
jgi:hypothetical protein